MKLRVGVAIALIVLAVGFALYCIFRVNRATDELAAAIETAMTAALEQSPEWEYVTQDLVRLWQRERAFLHILLPHMNLNELEWAIGSLPTYQRLGDHALFVEQSVRGLQCLQTIREMERPTLGNIF